MNKSLKYSNTIFWINLGTNQTQYFEQISGPFKRNIGNKSRNYSNTILETTLWSIQTQYWEQISELSNAILETTLWSIQTQYFGQKLITVKRNVFGWTITLFEHNILDKSINYSKYISDKFANYSNTMFWVNPWFYLIHDFIQTHVS